MDGKTEGKLFAPGYGEFYTRDGSDVEALALAVPTDALSSGTPPELTTMQSGAAAIFDAAASGEWKTASTSLATMTEAWRTFQSGEVPRLIEPWMTRALASLSAAVRTRDPMRTRQASIDTAQWSVDLGLRYRPPVEINLARFDLWAAQLLVDAAARNAAAVNGDVLTLFYLRDRIMQALTPAQVTSVNTRIDQLQVAGSEQDLARAAKAARRLRDIVASLRGSTA